MRSILLFGAALLGACGDDGVVPSSTRVDAAIDSPAILVDAPTSSCAHPRTVFLNRAGGMYAEGADDSTMNLSPTIDQMRTVDAFTFSDATWTTVKTCVQTELAKFGAVVTDVDPGTAPHHEIVFTTKYWDTVNENRVSSISGGSCTPGEAMNGVVFVFAGLIGGDTQFLCDAALGQLAIDVANLDWVLDCNDLQSGGFRSPCGKRTYLDTEVKCGEYSARECRCGGTTQNSFQKMRRAMCD